MTAPIAIFLITLLAAIKLINYGRWAGKQGNARGAIGLYLLAVLTMASPLGVYILNAFR